MRLHLLAVTSCTLGLSLSACVTFFSPGFHNATGHTANFEFIHTDGSTSQFALEPNTTTYFSGQTHKPIDTMTVTIDQKVMQASRKHFSEARQHDYFDDTSTWLHANHHYWVVRDDDLLPLDKQTFNNMYNKP